MRVNPFFSEFESLVRAHRAAATRWPRGQKSAGKRIALLSPRFWGMVKPKWRKHPAVLPIRFRIAEAGWPRVAEALSMPLGVHEGTA